VKTKENPNKNHHETTDRNADSLVDVVRETFCLAANGFGIYRN